MSASDKNIMEEVVLPERQAVLSSRKISSTSNGILRETRVPFCDFCGQRLDEERPSVICCACGRKLCSSDSCALEYGRRHYCEDDLQSELPLSKDAYIVLLGLIEGISVKEIRSLASLSNQDVQAIIGELLSEKYVEKRGLSIFSFYQVLQRGLTAWRTYAPAYRHDKSIAYFESELADCLLRKETLGCQRGKHLRK